MGRRGLSQCTAPPSVWRTPCSSRSHPAPGSLLGGTEGEWRGTNTGCCTPDLQPEHKAPTDTCLVQYHLHKVYHSCSFTSSTWRTQCLLRLELMSCFDKNKVRRLKVLHRYLKLEHKSLKQQQQCEVIFSVFWTYHV